MWNNPEEDEMKKFFLLVVSFVMVLSFVSCGNPSDAGIIDDLGEEIILTDGSPQRIVSLTPNITEILFYLGVGDRVVARTSFCNYPPEVESIPTVGDMMNLSVEAILGFEPDLVIANRMVPMEILDGLKGTSSRRIVVAAFDPNSIESLLKTIDRIAKICDVPSKTEELREGIEKITSQKSEPVIYTEIWGDPPMTFGKDTYGSDLISKIGGINLGDQILGDFPTTTHESIIDLNPDIIIIPDPYQETAQDIKKRNGYGNISAVKNDKIYSINADLLMRPSPRIIEILTLLQEIITD